MLDTSPPRGVLVAEDWLNMIEAYAEERGERDDDDGDDDDEKAKRILRHKLARRGQ